jgi:deoxyribose-phosphate aldolase
MIDHTLLRPEATPQEVAAHCRDAERLGVFSVCVSPSMLPLAAPPGGVAICTVIGFPSGAHRPGVKAAEAAQAVRDGADELDMVIDLGLAAAGRWEDVRADVAGVCAAAPGKLVKVIIESAALDDDGIAAACRAAVAGGAQFVKTSTGFHPAGGATIEAVRLMRQTVGPGIGVKASGGIRTLEVALAMAEAGADRLGLSSSRAILESLPV